MPAREYFRPYLTRDMLDAVCLLFDRTNQQEFENDPNLKAARKAIVSLQVKAGLNLTNPVYTTQPTIKEKLELDGPMDKGDLSPEKKRLHAYHKWVNVPALCSDDELEMAQTYRYENDLMSFEEKERWEDKIFGNLIPHGEI